LVASLEADRLTNLVLRDKQVSSEKEVVANERRFRVDDDVEGAANEILYRLAFERHPYGWPTIGWMEDIEAFTVADCQEFYRTFYAPNNVTLVVVGDFDEQQAVATIDKHYGHLKASSLTARTYPVEPPQSAQKRIEIAKPTTTEKILVGFKSPALASPDHAALSALSEILFEGRSSRFHRLFVKEKELATDVRSFLGSFADPALFEMYFACRDGVTIEQIEPLLAEQIGRLHTVGITDSELEKAKAKLELALLQSLENCAGKAEQMGYYETVLGQPAAAFDKLDRIRGLTRDDVDAVARKYLIETQSSVVVVRCAEQSEDD
jgi:zinc protease